MNFHPRPNSLYAILLRRPWWVSALVALGLVALAAALLPPQWFLVGAAAGIPFFGISLISAWRQRGKPSAARTVAVNERLRALNWPQLQIAVTQAWQHHGYQISAITDPGADFEVIKAGRRGLVSARRWKAAQVGVEPLRDLHAAQERHEVRDCWYLVTGEVSEPARRFATTNRISLLEGVELARWMAKLR